MPPNLLLIALQEVWKILDATKHPKAIAGGLALSFWGYPRSTQDIDIALVLSNPNEIHPLLSRAGLRPKKASGTIKLGFVSISQWVYSPFDAPIDIDIDLLIGDTEYHRLALQRAIPCAFPEIAQSLKVLSCEDLILFKAVSGRMIDLADIKMLVSHNATALDLNYLKQTSEGLGVRLELP